MLCQDYASFSNLMVMATLTMTWQADNNYTESKLDWTPHQSGEVLAFQYLTEIFTIIIIVPSGFVHVLSNSTIFTIIVSYISFGKKPTVMTLLTITYSAQIVLNLCSSLLHNNGPLAGCTKVCAFVCSLPPAMLGVQSFIYFFDIKTTHCSHFHPTIVSLI